MENNKRYNKVFCCEMMDHHANYQCDQHDSMWDCPDNIISYSTVFDEYGIIIHDGATSVISIVYCPWCGRRLPESKRDVWFEELATLGYEPSITNEAIPAKYKSEAWREDL